MKKIRNILLALIFTTALAAANPAEVESITLDRSSAVAGQTVTATVHLNSPAPAGGLQVELWSDDTVNVPTYVTIPAGQSEASFQVRTLAQNGSVSAHVAALQPQASASSKLQLFSSPAVSQK